jgi:glycosyltransferase involved in cell wall biosynthesis
MLRLYIDGSPLVADHFSGVGHYTLSITRALDNLLGHNDNFKVSVVVTVDCRPKIMQYGFANIDIRTIPMQREQFQSMIVEDRMPIMDKILGRGVYFFPNFVTWPLRRSKSITTVHDLSFEQVPQFVDDGNAVFLSRAVKQSMREANLIATVTEVMRNEISKFYDIPLSKVVLTSNAVDTSIFYRRTKAQINQVKKKYGINGEYIVCVGNIEPRKNQEKLIKAFLKLPISFHQRYSLVLIGAGGWKNEAIYRLINQSEGKTNIKVLEGKVPDHDMPAIYSGASISINPSFYEGFGMPTVEAMACKTAVVVSDIPVIREVAGDHAVYINPDSVSSITKGITSALTMNSTTRKEMIDSNYSKAVAYTWDNTVSQLLTATSELKPKPIAGILEVLKDLRSLFVTRH